MHLWVNVCDSNWNIVGSNPIAIQAAAIERVLDSTGRITLDTPAVTPGARQWLTPLRRFVLYTSNTTGGVQQITSGVISSVQPTASESGWRLQVSAFDALDELRRYSVLLNRIYDQQTLYTVASGLAELAGWNVEIDAAYASQLIDARFDGVSVLKALNSVASWLGLHLRLSTALRTVQIGAFGQSSGLRFTDLPLSPAGETSAGLAVIEAIDIDENADALVNRLVPIGGGEGEAALTLAKSTRTAPYPILTTTVNGKTIYYIQDDTSVATYGVSEKAGTFKDIQTIANSDPSLIIASNALYDAAVASLLRTKDPLYSYKVTTGYHDITLLPGDMARLVYKRKGQNDIGDVTLFDVDSDMYVMRASETYTADKRTRVYSLMSQDRYEMDEAEIIVGAIEDIQLAKLKPQTVPMTFSYAYRDTIQGVTIETSVNYKPARFQVVIDNTVTTLIRALIHFTTRPPFTQTSVSDIDADGLQVYYLWTTYEGSMHPRGISIFINGTDYTSTLGGPWGSGSQVDETLDITDILLAQPGGFRQTHEVLFKATETSVADARVSTSFSLGSGLECGNIEFNAQIFANTQAILPTS